MITFGEIESGEKELYIYGFFMLFSRLLFLIITAAVGIISGVFIESMAFFMAFFILRSYAGGIHAANEAACTILTSITLIISVLLVKTCMLFSGIYLSAGLMLLSTIPVLWLSPIDAPGKRLTAEEKQIYKKKTATVLGIILIVGVLALCGRWYGLLFACTLSVALEAILLLCAKLQTYIRKSVVKRM